MIIDVGSTIPAQSLGLGEKWKSTASGMDLGELLRLYGQLSSDPPFRITST